MPKLWPVRLSGDPRRARYLAALVITAAVVAGRLSLDPEWGRFQNRHLVFLPTVMICGWIGGFGPGLVSTILSTAAIDYFWTEPTHAFSVPGIELTLFFLISLAMCAIVGSLHAARARADEARSSLEQVLAIVAHDLRNPLGAIKLSACLIGQATDLDAARARARAIERAVGRMDNLIRDLVDATRIEHGALVVTAVDENLRSILEEVTELFAPRAREKGIDFEVPVCGVEATIRCDRDRLLQVLGNLIGNALKFTPEGGRITLMIEAADRVVRFTVSDTGPGIEPEHLAHIFERYWKADRRGTGLGLFIAQSIVRAHEGELGVRSVAGVGSCFFFTMQNVVPPGSGRASYLNAETRSQFQSR